MSYRVERQTNGQMDKWTNRKQIKSSPFYRTLFSHWAAAQKGTNKRGKEWKPVVQGDNALYNAWYIWPFIKPLQSLGQGTKARGLRQEGLTQGAWLRGLGSEDLAPRSMSMSMYKHTDLWTYRGTEKYPPLSTGHCLLGAAPKKGNRKERPRGNRKGKRSMAHR